jgi:hypothetical protein
MNKKRNISRIVLRKQTRHYFKETKGMEDIG